MKSAALRADQSKEALRPGFEPALGSLVEQLDGAWQSPSQERADALQDIRTERAL